MASEEQQFTQAASRLFAGDNSPMENPLFNLGTDLLTEFEQAKTLRLTAEQRWVRDLRQYKGIYEPEVEAKKPNPGKRTSKPRMQSEAESLEEGESGSRTFKSINQSEQDA